MKKEIKLKIGDPVRVKECSFKTKEHINEIGTIYRIDKDDEYVVKFKKIIAGSGDCMATKIAPLKSPKKKKEKPQEKFNWFDVRKEANGWTVKTYKDKAFVFNTKARLLKWIEKNI